jgi:hypothetical protein
MSDPAAARVFLQSEIEALEPFDFVAVGPAGEPLHVVELTRREDGVLEVRVPGRPPVVPEIPVPVRGALRDRGFASADPADPRQPWVREAGDAAAAVDVALRLLTEVFGRKPDAALDLAHGSHRAEHEARTRLAAVRVRLEKVLREIEGGVPEQDADGDYLLKLQDVHVVVAPRAAPGHPVVVRIFTVTNVGVNVTPELGLLLAGLNFGLMFGRFALDTEHRAVLVDETLLGEHFSDEELRFTIGVVARIADEWDDRLKQMFGGVTYEEVLTQRATHELPSKPGQGGYL